MCKRTSQLYKFQSFIKHKIKYMKHSQVAIRVCVMGCVFCTGRCFTAVTGAGFCIISASHKVNVVSVFSSELTLYNFKLPSDNPAAKRS